MEKTFWGQVDIIHTYVIDVCKDRETYIETFIRSTWRSRPKNTKLQTAKLYPTLYHTNYIKEWLSWTRWVADGSTVHATHYRSVMIFPANLLTVAKYRAQTSQLCPGPHWGLPSKWRPVPLSANSSWMKETVNSSGIKTEKDIEDNSRRYPTWWLCVQSFHCRHCWTHCRWICSTRVHQTCIHHYSQSTAFLDPDIIHTSKLRNCV